MKVEQLVTLLKAEVREAVREEIADLLKEAVEYASRVDTQQVPLSKNQEIREKKKKQPEVYPPLFNLLEETRKSMTSTDFSNLVKKEESINTESEGVNLESLGFLKKAKEIMNSEKFKT